MLVSVASSSKQFLCQRGYLDGSTFWSLPFVCVCGSLKMAAKLGAAPPLLLWLLCARSRLHHGNCCFQKLLPSIHISKPHFLFLLLNLIFIFIKAPDLSHSSLAPPPPSPTTSGLPKCSLEPMISVYNSGLLRTLHSVPCSFSALAHSSHPCCILEMPM